MDTALVLQLRDLFEVFDRHLAALGHAQARLAEAHRDTPMIARTVLQHALPTTFGLKAAGWLATTVRLHGRLGEMRPRVLALQFGGAAGTLPPSAIMAPASARNWPASSASSARRCPGTARATGSRRLPAFAGFCAARSASSAAT